MRVNVAHRHTKDDSGASIPLRITCRSIRSACTAHRRLAGNLLTLCKLQHRIHQSRRRYIGGVIEAHLHTFAKHPLAADTTLPEGIICRRPLEHNSEVRSLFQRAGTAGAYLLLHRADSLQRAIQLFSGEAAHHLNHAVYPGAVIKGLAHPTVRHLQRLKLHIRSHSTADADSTSCNLLGTGSTDINEKRFIFHNLPALSFRQQMRRLGANLTGNTASIARLHQHPLTGQSVVPPPTQRHDHQKAIRGNPLYHETYFIHVGKQRHHWAVSCTFHLAHQIPCHSLGNITDIT